MIKIYASDVKLPGYDSSLGFKFSGGTLGDVISSLFGYLLPLAGILMFGMIIYGGLTLIRQ